MAAAGALLLISTTAVWVADSRAVTLAAGVHATSGPDDGAGVDAVDVPDTDCPSDLRR